LKDSLEISSIISPSFFAAIAAPSSIIYCILASFLSWISAKAEVTASSEIASASAGAAAASSLSFLAFCLISAKSFCNVSLDDFSSD